LNVQTVVTSPFFFGMSALIGIDAIEMTGSAQ